MYLVFTRIGCISGGVYVPCIYSHARRVTVGDSGFWFVLVLTISSAKLTPLFVD